MIGKCSAMQTVLNGFMRYSANLRGELLEKFKVASVDLNPQAVMITCVDSRILASRITQANPGEILISRNPGNLVPKYNALPAKTSRPEEAALKLACLHDHVDTIVVAGHANCKLKSCLGFCTCSCSLKKYVCKHIVGLAVLLKYFQLPSSAKQISNEVNRLQGRLSEDSKEQLSKYNLISINN